jgi:hypothetical protein
VQNLTKLTILFTYLLVVGCKKEDQLPMPPFINFIEASLASNKASAVVKIDFLDENGDLGLRQEENKGQQEFNVFVDYYEKVNGEWILKSPIIVWKPDIQNPLGGIYDTTITNLRMPFITNEAQRALQGEISLDLLLDAQNFVFTPQPDTIKYELYILDRAFQKSNSITTTAIIIN